MSLEVTDLLDQIAQLTIENKQLKSKATQSIIQPIFYPQLPKWYEDMKSSPSSCVVDDFVQEWQDENWRVANGWMGTDFIHSKTRASVHVLEYLIVKKQDKTDENSGEDYSYSLVGPAYFSTAAESHRGLCHGGSMCALMDGKMCLCMSKYVLVTVL